MKLCYIADANSIHTRRWVEPFIRQGHDVHIISYKPVREPWAGATAIDLPRLTNLPKARFACWGWWTRRYVHKLRPDILHAHQLQAAGWLGAMAGYHPFVASAWGSDLLVEPTRSPLRRLLLRTVLARSDLLTVPSKLLYDIALSLGVPEGKVRRVPWGIETDVFRPTPDDRAQTRRELGLDPNAWVVLCPRSVTGLYNQDVILAAIKGIAPRVTRLTLALLLYNPDPGYLAQLRDLISVEGLEETVTWLPAGKSPEDMARLYRMADVMISIPSSEGYGFSVYEAMACGCPTVISDLPVFGDELVHMVHTLKAPPRDVGGTRRALESLLIDEPLRASLIRNGLQVIAGRTASRRVEQSMAIYRELRNSG